MKDKELTERLDRLEEMVLEVYYGDIGIDEGQKQIIESIRELSVSVEVLKDTMTGNSNMEAIKQDGTEAVKH